jgi:hypothetical protein
MDVSMVVDVSLLVGGVWGGMSVSVLATFN